MFKSNPNKVPNKNKHSNKRFHYTKKKGKWKPKHPFDNKKDADAFIEKYKMDSRGYVSYLCPYCSKWHIGKQIEEAEKTSKKKH